MNLLIDLGNSRLKWALYDKLALVKQGESLTHAELTPQRLTALWQSLQPQKIGLSCVGNTHLLDSIKSVIVSLWGNQIICHHAATQTYAFGVHNGYQQPEKLGIDRWLALIATRQIYSTHVCLVDCGTAITIDILNTQGQHEGGVISAGVCLMQKALASHTADLPQLTHANHIGLATDTKAAIYSGTVFAACGLIEHIMAKQPPHTTLLLTGGDAPVLSAQLNTPHTLNTTLVLHGLAIVIDALQ